MNSTKQNEFKIFHKVLFTMALDKGLKCVLLAGRRTGEIVTIEEKVDDNFVKVKTQKGKIRKCNVTHLEPL